MNKILISSNLSVACPEIHLSCITCKVQVEEKNEELSKLIDLRCSSISSVLDTEDIRHNELIAASRIAYKACGKDPARYRVSAEALMRRVVSGKGLYQINTVVDLLNLVSVSTGFSIGGYDADLIDGDIDFGIGQADEPYQGLGRGELNIEGMPVFRDQTGAFGSSTSDSERTGVSQSTKKFMMIIVGYGGNNELETATQMAIEFLTEFASAEQIKTSIIKTES